MKFKKSMLSYLYNKYWIRLNYTRHIYVKFSSRLFGHCSLFRVNEDIKLLKK